MSLCECTEIIAGEEDFRNSLKKKRDYERKNASFKKK